MIDKQVSACFCRLGGMKDFRNLVYQVFLAP
jgi:hypothetical protein